MDSVKIRVVEDPTAGLADYGTIPIAFQVTTVFDVLVRGTRQEEFELVRRQLAVPYMKDYDAIAGGHPTEWPKRFDLSNWGIFAAHAAGRRVGGAAVAFNTPDLEMLNGRSDIAALWDIRVAPDARGQGIGSALFNAAERWARARGCRELRIETQNINVAACRFYQRQGCVLVTADPSAYPGLPDETQLIWEKKLWAMSDDRRR